MSSKNVRIEEAKKRSLDRAERTPKQQLAALDFRLGKGVGAKKEREKLERLISGKAPVEKVKERKHDEQLENLDLLVTRFSVATKESERKKVAKEYAKIIKGLLAGDILTEPLAPEHCLPSDYMPDRYKMFLEKFAAKE